jgi:hypothetical protein
MRHITKAAVVAMAEPKEWLRITPDDRLRFAVQLEINGKHMCWKGSRNGTYGQFKFRSESKAHPQYTIGAHIFAYFNTHAMYLPSPGEIKGLDVGHTCTDHLCCEPLHLYLSTHDANMEERRYRG